MPWRVDRDSPDRHVERVFDLMQVIGDGVRQLARLR
jgi:hypothetical protein